MCLSAPGDVGYTFYYTYGGTQLQYYVTVANSEVRVQGVGSPVAANLVIPDSVTDNGETYSVTSIRDGGNLVTSVFYDARTIIASVTISDSVKTIGNYAFYECSSLSSVTIGNSVEAIGQCAFYGCYGLTGVLVIPDSVKTIDFWAFYKCSSLSSVTIGNSVEIIGDSAFGACSGLTSINVNSINTNYSTDEDGVLFNIDKTILIQYPPGRIGDYTIPDSVEIIGDYAFYYCHGLIGAFIIPDSVEVIGMEAFLDCSSISSITIGNSVEVIGDYAFHNCSGLLAVAVPYGTAINSSALPLLAKVVYYSIDGAGAVTATRPAPSETGTITLTIATTETVTSVSIGTTLGGNEITPTGSGSNWSFSYSEIDTYYVNVNYSEMTYAVAYNLTSSSGTGIGTVPTETNKAAGTTFSAASASGLTAPAGKQFKYWYTNDTGTSGISYAPGAMVTMSSSALMLYAIWEDIPLPTMYALTVIGGSGNGSYAAATPVTITATIPSGKQFNGWATLNGGTFENEGNISTVFTMPANAVTVTANFIDIPVTTYTVTYSLTSSLGTGMGTVPTETNKAAGAAFSAASASGLTAPAGKQFKQWNTKADGTGTAYGQGQQITMPASAVTLYAIWMDTPATVPIHNVAGGADKEWTKGNRSSGLTITINGDRANFKEVRVNGNLVDPSNYSVTTGSTIITFKQAYLNSLANGVFDVEVLFTDGVASATLTVSDDGSGNGDSFLGGIDSMILAVIAIVAIGGIGAAVFFFLRKH